MGLARLAVAGLAVGVLVGFLVALLRPRPSRSPAAEAAHRYVTIPGEPAIPTTIAAGAAG